MSISKILLISIAISAGITAFVFPQANINEFVITTLAFSTCVYLLVFAVIRGFLKKEPHSK